MALRGELAFSQNVILGAILVGGRMGEHDNVLESFCFGICDFSETRAISVKAVYLSVF